MNEPKVTYQRCRHSLTITLPSGSWQTARDYFLCVSDAIKEKAWELTKYEDGKDDAIYMEAIADAIAGSIFHADEDISDIFED